MVDAAASIESQRTPWPHRRFDRFCTPDRTRRNRPFGRSAYTAGFSTLSVVITSTLRSVLAEPRVPDAPTRVWRDWLIAGAIVIGSVIEMLTRRDVPWPIPTLLASVAVAATVFPRRQHPLAMTIIVLGTVNALSLAVWIVQDQVSGYYSMAFLLVVPYSLYRWGSGREAVAGVGILLAAWSIGITTDPSTIGEAIGGLMVLAMTAATGLVVRYRGSLRQRDRDGVKMREREQLARELHDTVAHHVSAIAIQAQAGQAVAATSPDAAIAALAVIEDAAKQALAEMRAMVGALRGSDAASLTPLEGIDDLRRLASAPGDALCVSIELDGDLDGLGPSVDAAVYRIAQESITNARRHARHATRVTVRVVSRPHEVELTVSDDGTHAHFDAETTAGFGLLGMTERAQLLGGSLSSGPGPSGGWTVEATLPRTRVGA